MKLKADGGDGHLSSVDPSSPAREAATGGLLRILTEVRWQMKIRNSLSNPDGHSTKADPGLQ
jgi:hypothetical protein